MINYEEKVKHSVEFGKPSKPSEYEADIKYIQKRVLENKGPYLPDKLSADVVIPVSDGEKQIGFGFIYIRGKHADIMRLIDPDEQGKGIGMLLLKKLENLGRVLGLSEIHSLISDNKKSAQVAMEKAGYKVFRKEEGRILYVKDIR